MRRALLLALSLVACSRREEARPVLEGTKASATPEPVYPLEALTCRDGVLGSVAAVASDAASAAPSVPSSFGAIGTIGSTAGVGGLTGAFGSGAPIADGGTGYGGGLGLSGVGGFGAVGLGRPLRLASPLLAAPVEARGPRALAVARAACAATNDLKRCHEDANGPVGSVVFNVRIANGRGEAADVKGGDLTDESLLTCLAAQLVSAQYERAANGSTPYRITFEPPKRVTPTKLKETPATVKGALPAEVIRRIIRARLGQIRYCYESALKTNPALAGDLKMKFTIDTNGSTKDVAVDDGTLTDPGVRACVTKVFTAMTFPEPDGGVVNVTYPVHFAPG